MNNNGIATNVNPNTFMALNADEFQDLMEAGESEVYKTLDSKIEDKSEEQKEILAYLSGKMRMHRIKVLIGDSVEIVLDPYGGKGRIIKRL